MPKVASSVNQKKLNREQFVQRSDSENRTVYFRLNRFVPTLLEIQHLIANNSFTCR